MRWWEEMRFSLSLLFVIITSTSNTFRGWDDEDSDIDFGSHSSRSVRWERSGLISSHLISSHLISSHLISSHLISLGWEDLRFSSWRVRSWYASSHLISSSHLLSSPLICSHPGPVQIVFMVYLLSFTSYILYIISYILSSQEAYERANCIGLISHLNIFHFISSHLISSHRTLHWHNHFDGWFIIIIISSSSSSSSIIII